MPDVYRGYDAREAGQEAVARGMKAASALGNDLTPADVDPEEMDADTAEALALAVIIQTWDFIRGGAWENVDPDVLPMVYGNVERDFALVEPLRVILRDHAGDVDREPVITKLTSLERHLSQYTREGRKILDQLGIEEDSVSCDLSDSDNRISFDSMDDSGEIRSPILLAARKLTDSVTSVGGRASVDGRPSIGKTMRTALDTEEMRVRQADDKAARTARKTDRRRKFRLYGLVSIVILTVLAAVSIFPLLRIGAPPTIDTYAELVPIAGVIRPADDRVPHMIVIVNDDWDVMTEQQRTTRLQALFEQAHQVENTNYIVVRNRRGFDSARVDSVGVTHYR